MERSSALIKPAAFGVPLFMNPPPPPQPSVVHKVEILISNLLRTGVVTSLTIIVIGTVMTFVHHPQYLSSRTELQHLTQPGAAFPHDLKRVSQGLSRLEGRSVIVLGLLLLIGTPVMRVAVSIVAFLYQKDYVFVAVTSIVLGLLLLSFVLGKAGG